MRERERVQHEVCVPADQHDAFLLDLDGVVFRGAQVVAGAAAAIAELAHRGPVRFVTNNASRTPDQVAGHLRGLGVAAVPAQIHTAAQAAVELLVEQVGRGEGRPVLAVGGDGITQALTQAGFAPVESADDQPIAVLQGFSPDLNWPQLAQASYAIGDGALWIAANLDATLPTERGEAPGNGAFVALLQAATGQTPMASGKPQPQFLTGALIGLQPTSPVMVGDRLDTDIAAALAADLAAALVLTGVTTPLAVMSAAAAQRPDYLLNDLGDLLLPYRPARLRASGPSVRADVAGWWVQVDDDALTIGGDGPTIEGLRALAAVAWWGADAGHPIAEPRLVAGVEQVQSAR
jgi:glycerol 3-phosphatase-2